MFKSSQSLPVPNTVRASLSSAFSAPPIARPFSTDRLRVVLFQILLSVTSSQRGDFVWSFSSTGRNRDRVVGQSHSPRHLKSVNEFLVFRMLHWVVLISLISLLPLFGAVDLHFHPSGLRLEPSAPRRPVESVSSPPPSPQRQFS